MHCQWECKLAQPLWKTAQRFCKKSQLEMPSGSEVEISKSLGARMTEGQSLYLLKLVPFLLLMLLQLSQYFLLCPHPPSRSPIPKVSHHNFFHVHGLCIYVVCLIPSPFSQFPPPSSPLIAVSLFHVSVPILFCLLVYNVHQIPLVSEVIWYLPLIDWFISLSIRVSTSIYAVEKVRILLFSLLCSI